MRPMLDALAQHINHAAPGDLALEPGQELSPRPAVVVKVESVGCLRLRGAKKGCHVEETDGVLTLIVLGVACNPATVGRGQVVDNECLQPLVADICAQPTTSSSANSSDASSASSPPVNASSTSRSSSGSSASSGRLAAASRTSSLPVTTSAIRRVPYSRTRSISSLVLAIARLRFSTRLPTSRTIHSCSSIGGTGTKISRTQVQFRCG